MFEDLFFWPCLVSALILFMFTSSIRSLILRLHLHAALKGTKLYFDNIWNKSFLLCYVLTQKNIMTVVLSLVLGPDKK